MANKYHPLRVTTLVLAFFVIPIFAWAQDANRGTGLPPLGDAPGGSHMLSVKGCCVIGDFAGCVGNIERGACESYRKRTLHGSAKWWPAVAELGAPTGGGNDPTCKQFPKCFVDQGPIKIQTDFPFAKPKGPLPDPTELATISDRIPGIMREAGPGCDKPPCVVGGMGGFIQLLYTFMLGAISILAVIMIMVSGLQWIFSAGVPEKITKSKEMIINSLIGLALALGSYMILYIISPNLTNLSTLKVLKIPRIDMNVFCKNISQNCLAYDNKTTAKDAGYSSPEKFCKANPCKVASCIWDGQRCRTNAAPGQTGANCSATQPCQTGFWCVTASQTGLPECSNGTSGSPCNFGGAPAICQGSNHCVVDSNMRARCSDGTVGSPCGRAEDCDHVEANGNPADVALCSAGRCLRRQGGNRGEPCRPGDDSAICRAGFTCRPMPGTATGYTCQDGSLNEYCSDQYNCDFGNTCINNRCAAPGGAGSQCDSDTDCAGAGGGYLLCQVSSHRCVACGGANRCTPGYTCISDGRCVQGSGGRGSPCGANTDCKDSNRCVSGACANCTDTSCRAAAPPASCELSTGLCVSSPDT